MTTHEMYYLILVLAAFCGLGVFLVVETIVYRRSLPRIGYLPHDKPHP
ncbi:hypothetical protein SAMN02745126_03484 [Enhydrobacter aerosaccus]|uniref:Uncharacterized protein n=1 Tax=Enhydrobacter aerosaccus TaxID=225324 RepID=A0A1T4R109_9HYPH|nr:hypothetical protein [Enhydrobacter aerosaccus]SKA09742.1 hypothetical protein SAMN02745126_03484 [Enhydrobacter aerosaccus]